MAHPTPAFVPVEPGHNIRFGLVGYGYWGPNLARNIGQHAEATLVSISDLDEGRLTAARRGHSLARTTTDFREILRDPTIDAVVVATPPATHHRIVMEALESGKHVLVEKPLATSGADAEAMVKAARACGRTLAVDHTFLFTGAVKRIKQYFDAGDVGEVYYYDSTRINLGLFNHHTNVIWDLAPHDISIMQYLIDQPVRRVSAIGERHVDTNVENIAYITLQFDSQLLAHFHVNWLAPVKVRRTIIGGSKKMLVYDDTEPSEKLRVYDSGAQLSAGAEDMYQQLVQYRTGDVVAPKIEQGEALATELSHFIRVLRGTEEPISGGDLGVRVVKVIEAAQASLRLAGAFVEVSA